MQPLKSIDDFYPIRQAINQIYEDYGDKVSVYHKKKSLDKFGLRSAVGTTFVTVMPMQGAELDETFETTNAITKAVSTSPSDVGQVTLECHTINTSGEFTFLVQTVTLDGTNEADLLFPVARANRGFATPSGDFSAPAADLVGTISVFNGTNGSVAGVPVTPSATKLILLAGKNHSEKAATTVSNTDYYLLTGAYCGVGQAGGSATSVSFEIQTRDVANGGVWRPLGSQITVAVDGGNSRPIEFNPYRIVPKNHDVRIRAATNANTAQVYAELQGVLAKIIDYP